MQTREIQIQAEDRPNTCNRFSRGCIARRLLFACAGALLMLPACLELDNSPYDTSNGGLLGALVTILGSNNAADPSVFLAFTDQTHFFKSIGDGEWERVDFTGATGSVRQVKSGGGEILWGLDANATNNIVRSDDFGKTWTSVNVAAQAFATLDVCGTTIFTTFINGPQYDSYYSTDSGATWNTSTILAGTFTTQDALCVSSTVLYAAKNNTPPVQRSTDSGANWGAGAGLGTFPQVRIASRTGTGEILVLYQATNPQSNLSTDGLATYGPADSATFGPYVFNGALTADANSYYTAMRNNLSCDLFSNPTGAANNYTTFAAACGVTTNLTHAAVGNSTVLYGGGESGAPRMFRHSLNDSTTVQETLPGSSATMLTDILFVP